MFSILVSLFINFGFQAQGLALADSEVCGQEAQPIEYSWCVSESSKPGPLLVFLHDFGGNEASWKSESSGIGSVKKVWEKEKKEVPSVLSISFGGSWLLAPKNSSAKSGLLTIFLEQVLPDLETRLLHFSVRDRWLLGISMGGFNAAMLALWAPEKFQKIVLGCPALFEISPYASKSEWAEFGRKSGADLSALKPFIALGKEYYSDEQSWGSGAPLGADTLALWTAQFPELLVTYGNHDQWGISLGGREFLKRARDVGVRRTDLLEVSGDHCAFDVQGIANFLIPSKP